MIEHKENCLIINGKQSAKLKCHSIRIKNYFKQLPVPFQIYADFECILKGVKSSDKINGSYTEKYLNHVPCSFSYKVVSIDNKFSKKVVLYRGKILFIGLLKQFLKSMITVKKIMKRHFNKNLIKSSEEEEIFQLSNSCWIYDKLFDAIDDKVRDHCHITGKYSGAAHWSCNVNLSLSKKIPVIFHNLRSYDSHLIIKEISKFNVKVSVIPNGLEKYMAFTINRNLVFIDRTQLMNSSLDSLIKN